MSVTIGTRASDWLHEHRRNVHSQWGEDGILERCFELIPATGPRWAVEFGAWDGRHLSNTCNLIQNHGWHAVMIEGNPGKTIELRQTYAGREDVHCVNALVSFAGETSLDSILAATPIPTDFDLLSIDIDGNDYHVWASLERYEPKVVIIEFNMTIPNEVSFTQPADMEVRQGSSLRAMAELAGLKGYALVATTDANAIFVRADYFDPFGIRDNSLDTLRPDTRYLTRVFQLFDGTLVYTGCKELLWHSVPIRDADLQVLPDELRFFMDSDLPPDKQALADSELPTFRY